MWPAFYILGQRFSTYLVLPIAAVVGTIGYYAETKLFRKQQPIPYLQQSVQDQREQRLARGEAAPTTGTLPNTLGVLRPKPVDQ